MMAIVAILASSSISISTQTVETIKETYEPEDVQILSTITHLVILLIRMIHVALMAQSSTPARMITLQALSTLIPPCHFLASPAPNPTRANIPANIEVKEMEKLVPLKVR